MTMNRKLIHPLDGILQAVGLVISEEIVLPGREARFGHLPSGLHPLIARYLKTLAPNGIYSHQALALKKFLAGEDLVLGTATASGKSLIFGAAAAQTLLDNPGSKVLACYPMKALANDQERKWLALGNALNLNVGVIHGGVATADRLGLLERSDVVLCTPDVLQSWMLGALPKTRQAISQVHMVILDEMASYNGIFASNAAYLFRRLAAHLGHSRWITATATMGNPVEFARSLTARDLTFIGPDDDGSPAEPKRVLLVQENRSGALDLIKALKTSYTGTVLAFADARKGAEDLSRLVEVAEPGSKVAGRAFLPFRAGLEDADRHGIQQALASGELCGLISTSALEVGVDLPNVDLVMLLNVPHSVQSTLQRIGRIRGGTRGTVLIFDSDRLVHRMGLRAFLARPAEANSIYTDNAHVMYANALCAARELQETGGTVATLRAIPSWGTGFLEMVANELNPTASIPDHLFAIKQRVANRLPHHEFPLRGAVEPNYQMVLEGGLQRVGTLTLAQRLREAAPGMVYGYAGRSYRVVGAKDISITVRPERNRFAKTSANLQTMAFPKWTGPVWSHPSAEGTEFVALTEMQICERCMGFSETVGKTTTSVLYGPGSSYSQRPLTRVFPTTGVVIDFGHALPEAVGEFIVRAYAQMEGIHVRDLGTGPAHSQNGPRGGGQIRGLAIFDTCPGGLDLTRKLAESFATYVAEAARLAELEGPDAACAWETLRSIAGQAAGFHPSMTAPAAAPAQQPTNAADGWITGLLAPGATGLMGNDEVSILDLTYARDGVRYRLQHASPTVRWLVPVSQVLPVPGGQTCRYHVDTGEVQVVG